MDKRKLRVIYELTLSAMSVVSVVIAILDLVGRINLQSNRTLSVVDTAILFIFAIDYFARFVIASDKKSFIKQNIPDLIAIIPFSAFFKVFRTAKLFRLIKVARFAKFGRFARIFALGLKFKKSASRFLHTNGLIYMLTITACLVIIGALGIFAFERGTTVETFGDALWWSFVTTTTVGYGDISPATGYGRIIAGILMLCGIGTNGLLTGTVATYFISSDAPSAEPNPDRILDLSDVDDDMYKEILDFVEFVRKKGS